MNAESLILTQAKTTSVNHSYISKEDRLEAGRARLRKAAAAKEVSDESPRQSFLEINLIMLILLAAHTGPFIHLPHGCSGRSASNQPLNYS
jgi:hypothetical protein